MQPSGRGTPGGRRNRWGAAGPPTSGSRRVRRTTWAHTGSSMIGPGDFSTRTSSSRFRSRSGRSCLRSLARVWTGVVGSRVRSSRTAPCTAPHRTAPGTAPVGDVLGHLPEGDERLPLVGPHPLAEVAHVFTARPVVGQVDQLVRVAVVVVPLVVVVVEGAVHVEQFLAGRLPPQAGRRFASADAVVAGVLGPTVVEAAQGVADVVQRGGLGRVLGEEDVVAQ